MLGFSLSLTVRIKLHVAVLPAPSVTFQTTVVIPFGKTAPAREGVKLRSFWMTGVPQLSPYKIGLNSVPETVYVQTPGFVALTWLGTHEIVGGVKSGLH